MFSFLQFVNQNKHLNNLDRSFATEKDLKPRPSRIDLAIACSIRQGLSLKFSRNELTLGYQNKRE